MSEVSSSQEQFVLSLDMDEVLDELLKDAAAILPTTANKKFAHHIYQAKVILLSDRARRYQTEVVWPEPSFRSEEVKNFGDKHRDDIPF